MGLILSFLILPFLASLILTGIHAYLGVHVVERGVIFVDLALAQIAALGATIAILAGMDPHARGAYWMSLAFTFLGAAIFALVRKRKGRIPLEAFIGITYAVASAAAILAMSKATGETEHLKDMLVGNILAVSKEEVIRTAILYGAIGLFHYIFRRKFLLISTDPECASKEGLSIGLWDFTVLRFLWIRGHVVGGDRRGAAGVLLPGGAVGGSDAVRRPHWTAVGDWMDDGSAGIGAGLLLLGVTGPADRSDHRVYLRRRAAAHVPGAAVRAEQDRCVDTELRLPELSFRFG
jgi:hypothetical protein